uniref:Uncharacterized protein n=1 Tax=Myotis myotis TaxID=51298 RepID=A0A7J7S1Y8_MYOMY|nr:hypothetical protein mMyoMyo1_010046 [Myotis myotis]
MEPLAWSFTSLPLPAPHFKLYYCVARASGLPSLCLSFSFIKHKQKLQNFFWPLLTALHIVHSFIHSFNNPFTECQPPAKPGLNQGIYPWGEFILHKLHKRIISGQKFSFLTSKDLHANPQEPSVLPSNPAWEAACFYLVTQQTFTESLLCVKAADPPLTKMWLLPSGKSSPYFVTFKISGVCTGFKC